jgi:hypothetical protein
MSGDKTRATFGTPVLRRYAGYAVSGGLAIGLFMGVLLSGPHFFVWPVGQSLAVVFGCAARSLAGSLQRTADTEPICRAAAIVGLAGRIVQAAMVAEGTRPQASSGSLTWTKKAKLR